MYRTAFASALAFALLSSATAGAQDSANTSVNTSDVPHVMAAFHEAVVHHDGARLAALFIPEGSAWLNVLSDDAYARAKAKSPDTKKVRVGSYTDFAKFVSTTTSNLDPEHSHVRIQSDGTIATVYFDFVFNIDGKAQNRGHETWQLVKGPDGWRIAAITYSSEGRPS